MLISQIPLSERFRHDTSQSSEDQIREAPIFRRVACELAICLKAGCDFKLGTYHRFGKSVQLEVVPTDVLDDSPIIQSISDQQEAAKASPCAYVGLLTRKLPAEDNRTPADDKWTWYVARVFQFGGDADWWWQRQKGLCRIYRRTGDIFNAK